MTSIRFRPSAEAEVEAAFAWYEAQRLGLGQEFITELDAVLQRIQLNPALYPVYKRDTRCAPLRRFPYLVFYRAVDDSILVVACIHPRRNPALRPF